MTGLIEHVVIIGAGFSGTLQAINLLHHDGPRATLIERSPAPGDGIAYGTAHPAHLLNVRAANMSAFPDDPGHFVRWLDQQGVAHAPTAFVQRLTYGRYLRDLLSTAQAQAGGRLRIVAGEAIDIEEGDGVAVRLRDGTTISADAAVLAVGNLPPHAPAALDPTTLSSPRWKGDPWAGDIGDGLRGDDTVLLIGTGLTMVDVAVMLEARGLGGRIVALSRRGLLPHRHAVPPQPWRPIAERPRGGAATLLRATRHRAMAIGWREAVDELRPFTQAIWANAAADQRARFLRHLRPWWDIHRHRLAPPVADRIAAMRANGRLIVAAGKIEGALERDEGVEIAWRARGEDAPRRLLAQRIVNCTGPQGDLARTTETLLARLVARGAIRADPDRLGIDVDARTNVIGSDGQARARLFALGPMTRGAFWEIVAVPDVRRQTWDLARRLANAHWIAAEGL